MNKPIIQFGYDVNEYQTSIHINGELIFQSRYDKVLEHTIIIRDDYQAYLACGGDRNSSHPIHVTPRSTGILVLPTILMRMFGPTQMQQWFQSEEAPSLTYQLNTDDGYQGYTVCYGHILVNATPVTLELFLDDVNNGFGAMPDMNLRLEQYTYSNFSTLLGFAAIGMWLNNNAHFKHVNESIYPFYPFELPDDFFNGSYDSKTAVIPSLVELSQYMGDTLFPNTWTSAPESMPMLDMLL